MTDRSRIYNRASERNITDIFSYFYDERFYFNGFDFMSEISKYRTIINGILNLTNKTSALSAEAVKYPDCRRVRPVN